MGQKGLSTIHRIDTSMIWHSYIYNKEYKWLSYNLWFAYIQFYKIIFFTDTQFNLYTSLAYKNNTYVYTNITDKIFKLTKLNKRFSYHVELYCFEFNNFLLLLNVFFKANLKFFKNPNSEVIKYKKPILNKINFL